ncbi:hypothetical protein PoB_000978200 [Plakobranchus ocellatus]|uniref:Uncharacterized protein n=1 Tax=Plakobranchus ocellatus TaxID=259542 RepID=A0AAV3YLL6_9GAST|nr:hypothetical protein PoB_000978200 [Plakobranchus ocellatus]
MNFTSTLFCLTAATEKEDPVSTSPVPPFGVISAVVAELLLLLCFSIFILLYRRLQQNRRSHEDSMSTISDSVASSLKPPRPYLGYGCSVPHATSSRPSPRAMLTVGRSGSLAVQT